MYTIACHVCFSSLGQLSYISHLYPSYFQKRDMAVLSWRKRGGYERLLRIIACQYTCYDATQEWRHSLRDCLQAPLPLLGGSNSLTFRYVFIRTVTATILGGKHLIVDCLLLVIRQFHQEASQPRNEIDVSFQISRVPSPKKGGILEIRNASPSVEKPGVCLGELGWLVVGHLAPLLPKMPRARHRQKPPSD